VHKEETNAISQRNPARESGGLGMGEDVDRVIKIAKSGG